MKQIVTCKEMKALDGNMIEGIGIPSCVLMERAALKVAEELERTLADKNRKNGFSVSAETGTTEEMAWLLPVF